LPGKGWYAVLVSAKARGVEGRYHLEVNYALAPSGGGLVVNGQTVTGSVSNSDFTDTWHIDATKGTSLTVNLTRTSGDLDLEMAFYAPDGTQIPIEKQNAEAFKLEGYKFSEGGTYTLMVSRAGGAGGKTSGTYQLQVSTK
jgi:hypothetical protein